MPDERAAAQKALKQFADKLKGHAEMLASEIVKQHAENGKVMIIAPLVKILAQDIKDASIFIMSRVGSEKE